MSRVGNREAVASRPFVWPLSVVAFAFMPAFVLVLLFVAVTGDDSIAMDFRQFYWAAEVMRDGQSPYVDRLEPLAPWGGPYPYPPLPALLAIPLTALPLDLAGLLVMGALVGVALATLRVLGVRDWRCYGLALLWPPVISAIQTANVTLWFGLALAIVWRYRARWWPVAAALGVTLSVKFFLWPFVVWLAASRRYAAAAGSCAVGAGLLALSWAPLGFAGLVDYPHLLQRLEDAVGADSYTLYIAGLDAGLSLPVARALWLTAGLTLLVCAALLAWRGRERQAFVVVLGACLALTPIVWLHYFALLLVLVAVAQPRLGPLWFIPLAFVLTPGSGQPTPFETAWTLAVAALVLGLGVRAAGEPSRALARPPRVGPTSLVWRRRVAKEQA